MKRLNQEGAVSIISVVIFITIITIVVSAYLVSAISQQRTAVNFDMGTRAYYAAESGVQDMVRYAAQTPTVDPTKDDCLPLKGGAESGQLGNEDYGVTYTCQIVSSKPTEITGQARPNEVTAMFRLSPGASVGATPKLVIKWSSSTSLASTSVSPGGAPPETLVPRTDGSKVLPQLTNWKNSNGQAYHAMIRLNVVSHPKTGPFGSSAIKQHVIFLNPASTAEPATITQDSDSVGSEGRITNARCVESSGATAGYSCEMSIDLKDYKFDDDSVYVRVGALYRPTNFSVQLMENPTTPVSLINAQATIDVTGRAKDVYRRVKQTFPIKGGYFEDRGPDAAVVAGEGICKLFSITNDPSNFSSNCDPTQP